MREAIQLLWAEPKQETVRNQKLLYCLSYGGWLMQGLLIVFVTCQATS